VEYRRVQSSNIGCWERVSDRNSLRIRSVVPSCQTCPQVLSRLTLLTGFAALTAVANSGNAATVPREESTPEGDLLRMPTASESVERWYRFNCGDIEQEICGPQRDITQVK
jgi:hypothetical protein